ncbi:MAG: hypothetical protein HZA50_11025 [Planctomycetes bacterium]|nr:hypothetical protein [Planctomycetota bacterium]
MSGSWMVRVIKRDCTIEPFDERKIMRMACLALPEKSCQIDDLRPVADGVKMYLKVSAKPCIPSAELFDLAARSLNYVGLTEAVRILTLHRAWRAAQRRHLRIVHDDGRCTLWDKSWLCEHAIRGWNVSRQAARIVAAEIEEALLTGGRRKVERKYVLVMLGARLGELGLVDVVPVGSFRGGI